MTGKVKSFSPKHGYGFILGDLDEIFFFHAKEWKHSLKPFPGEKVEFEPIITSKGSRATNIRRLRNGKE